MRSLLPSVLTTLAAALPVAAQSLPEGYSSRIRPLAPGTSHVLALTGALAGETAWFDGTDLMFSGHGAPRTLLALPAPVFGSFVLEVDANRLLFGESSSGSLWLVPINGAPPVQPLANVPFNYDAAMLSPTLAVVSAKTSGFSGPDNDLVVVDVATGATQLLATIPGASGPVALEGDLFYATATLQYPAPAGQTSILRFPLATVLQALSASQVLGQSHAQVVFAGLDSASDIAFDADGDLLFVDWYRSVVGEIDDLTGPAPVRKDLLDYAAAAVVPSGLQYLAPATPCAFEPFQPVGGTLHVHETDFVGYDAVRVVQPAAAGLAVAGPQPVPTGPFTLRLAGGPANGAGLIAFALPGSGGPGQLTIPGFEQPLSWHADLLPPAATHLVTLSAQGDATLVLVNPGFAPALTLLLQAAFVDAGATVIGATAHRLTTLGL